jgi:hypothetical protein
MPMLQVIATGNEEEKKKKKKNIALISMNDKLDVTTENPTSLRTSMHILGKREGGRNQPTE